MKNYIFNFTKDAKIRFLGSATHNWEPHAYKPGDYICRSCGAIQDADVGERLCDSRDTNKNGIKRAYGKIEEADIT